LGVETDKKGQKHMNTEIRSDPDIEAVFANYPYFVHDKMLSLRKLVHETVEELETVTALEETLKWGEPSFLTKHGSTLRMDWKDKSPDQYALYFKCTSRLVPTFKTVFGDLFTYEGNRAILFRLDDHLPEDEVKACIKATLMYHKVKHLPMLGLL
jgi:hypothetical protein